VPKERLLLILGISFELPDKIIQNTFSLLKKVPDISQFPQNREAK
jgi:hypothetical protein